MSNSGIELSLESEYKQMWTNGGPFTTWKSTYDCSIFAYVISSCTPIRWAASKNRFYHLFDSDGSCQRKMPLGYKAVTDESGTVEENLWECGSREAAISDAESYETASEGHEDTDRFQQTTKEGRAPRAWK